MPLPLALLRSLALALCLPAAADAALPDQGWPAHGYDAAETRYSPLAQIARDNVDALGLAWHFRFDRPRGVQATPLMVGDTLYVSGPWGVVYALAARNGALRWQHDPKVPAQQAAVACCDVVNRGVAVADGRVFVGTLDGRLQALDARNGVLLWSVQTTNPERPYTITGAPRVAAGLVMIGNGGAEYGVRGYLSAYDAANGELRWRFYTVPKVPTGTSLTLRSKRWPHRPGRVNGGHWAAAVRCGTRWPTTPSWTCSTSALATARRTTATAAARAAATIFFSPPSSRCGRRPASTSGTTRPPRATAGTTPPPST